MKDLGALFFACLILICAGCQNKKPPKPAHLRAISVIQYTPATLTIQGKGKNKSIQKTLSLHYGEPTAYQQLPKGYYQITLRVNGKDLLKGTYALGKNGYYSLLATGLLPQKWTVNPQTTLFHIKYIFAGAELESANKYLPQWFMLRDNYDGNKESGYIRLVNANPHTAALTIKKDNKALKSGLAYPMESEMLKLKSGSHNLQVSYGNITLGRQKIIVKPGYIYTAVISNKETSKDALTFSILKNPSRTLLQAK